MGIVFLVLVIKEIIDKKALAFPLRGLVYRPSRKIIVIPLTENATLYWIFVMLQFIIGLLLVVSSLLG